MQPIRAEAPDRRRVRQHKGLDARRPRTPLVLRTVLPVLIVVLAAGTFFVAVGGVGPVVSALAAGFGSAFGKLTETPIPERTLLPPTDSPRITPPAQPYTNRDTVDLNVSVPVEVLGDPTARIRFYLALEGLEPAPVFDVNVGTTSRMVVPFALTEGRNTISATLFRAEDESEHSPSVSYILDLTPPKIAVVSPRNGAAIEAPQVRVRGTTQGNTALIARNAKNGTSISTAAGGDGEFEFVLQLATGVNEIEITGTDPAGNVGSKNLKILQGSDDVGVRLSASTYRISVKNPPPAIQLVVIVTDPTGEPLADATAFFTMQIPGLAPISNELQTGPDGRAVFTTPLVGELATGGGIGTVLITTDLYGQSTDRVSLTFVK